MRSLLTLAAAIIILIVALLSMTLTQKRSEAPSILDSSAVASTQQTEIASRVEYKSLAAKSPEALVAQANQGASDSWQLVSVVRDSSSNLPWVGFFKRLKQ